MTKVAVAAALLLLGTSAAYAEAPGEWAAPPPAASVYPAEPVMVVAAAPVEVDWMAHRLSVGLSLGTMDVSGPYDIGTSFSVSELAVRYRASRRLELEVLAGGGRETFGDGTDGDLAMGNFVVDARFRFRPEHRWGWYALIGVGGTVIASHTADTDEQAREQRPMVVTGIGADVRISPRWSLQAEMRGYSIGPTSESNDVLAGSATANTTQPSPVARTADGDQLGGGQFTLGASLYF